jgi:hypothetical protein
MKLFENGQGQLLDHVAINVEEKAEEEAAPKRKSDPEIAFSDDLTKDGNLARERNISLKLEAINLFTQELGSMYYKGVPPFPPYLSCPATICHLSKKKADLCCLKLNHECPHSKATHISNYKFARKPIILAAEYSNNAIYNFILPLRSANIPKNLLYPILIVFEKELVDFVYVDFFFKVSFRIYF